MLYENNLNMLRYVLNYYCQMCATTANAELDSAELINKGENRHQKVNREMSKILLVPMRD